MTFGDAKSKTTRDRAKQEAFNRAKLAEELASEQYSNIEVGDFLSELASAIRFRIKTGLSAGDWIEEPERIYTDGLIFATEQSVASEVKLQITVSLDTSTSMYVNKLMKHAGPAFLALDRVIRKSMRDLPEGSVHYAPFIFHETAHKIPASYLQAYVGRLDLVSRKESTWVLWQERATRTQLEAAIEAGELPPTAKVDDFLLSGESTRIAPLFQAIKTWEETYGDTSAVRLDIVITDGVLEEAGDVEAATQIQEQRGGRLRTVLLNFLPLSDWSIYPIPDRCSQFPVEANSLNQSIRDILSESIADLF